MLNFTEDIKNYILNEFKEFGITYKLSGDLNKDLLNLFTIQKKYVFPVPRHVEISNELKLKIENNHKHTSEILNLIEHFFKGNNVNPFQSDGLFNHNIPDHLVYDWRIYHFHLSTKRTKDEYFFDRTKYVLFVYIDDTRALFLDLDKHEPPYNVFADKKLLEIIDNNWDGILKIANGVLGISHDLNKSERFKSRKSGVNEGIVEVNGKFVFPAGYGLTTSKHSIETVLMLNHLNKWIKQNTKAINLNKEKADSYFLKKHNINGAIDYKLVFTENGPQIIDYSTKTILLKYLEVLKIDNN